MAWEYIVRVLTERKANDVPGVTSQFALQLNAYGKKGYECFAIERYGNWLLGFFRKQT
jgi:hypothetical protein